MSLDPNQLLATGAIAGPYRRTRPATLTWRIRACRCLRALIRGIRFSSRHLRQLR